ncbi:MAG TPA: 23S rRNA (uracil(1939)-C(5))-methyltransferase RlmD [Bacteroidia bacterium]|nr:23S rRNA (uracil(1939)-C(5))-methyltransferase RlmD [Bacteroidia bacterium]
MTKGILESIEMTDMADKGRAVGRTGDVVVFASGAVPGDVIDAEVIKKFPTYIEAKALHINTPSPFRTDPFCTHFGTCGGCKWQNLDYRAQLTFKEKQVRDAMIRIAKLKDPEILPIIGSDRIQYYRNKLEFSFTNKRYLLKEEIDSGVEKIMDGLGFHIPGKFNKILDIDTCYLQHDLSNRIRNFISTYAKSNAIPFFDIRKQTGMLRSLIIRNTEAGEWMVIVVFREEKSEVRVKLLDAVVKEFPELTSVMYIINTKKNDTVTDQAVHLHYGRSYLMEQMEDLKFMIGPKSFFQTNTRQAALLYKLTKEYAGLTGSELVYDLYTGTGTIAAFIAKHARNVIGVEYVAEAIEDAKQNAKINGLENLEFFSGDLKDVLTTEFTAQHGHPDVVITDPPRAGMHEHVTKRLLEMAPEKIVYVSCNPGTQARDLLLLSEKYELVRMQPVDMFPHTSHVENVALLRLK